MSNQNNSAISGDNRVKWVVIGAALLAAGWAVYRHIQKSKAPAVIDVNAVEVPLGKVAPPRLH